MKRTLFLFLLACVTVFLATASVWADTPRPAFVTGADLSELPYYESIGVKYTDGGREETLLRIAKQNHCKIIRVRLWVNPSADPKARVSTLPM